MGSIVADYVNLNPIVMKSNNSFHEALRVMEANRIGNCIILEDQEPIGILSEREILWYLAFTKEIPNTPIKQVILQDFENITPRNSMLEAAKAMIQSKRKLLVFENDKLLGIITATDIIRALKDLGVNSSLKGIITNRIYSVDYFESILYGIKVMQKHRIGSVIVNKKNGKEIPFGIFTERDLLNKILPLQVNLDENIGKFCSTPLITSDHKTISTAEAVKIMLSNNIKRLPLKENHGIYSILTARDLVEAWSK